MGAQFKNARWQVPFDFSKVTNGLSPLIRDNHIQSFILAM